MREQLRGSKQITAPVRERQKERERGGMQETEKEGEEKQGSRGEKEKGR